MSANLHIEAPVELRGGNVVIRSPGAISFPTVFISSTVDDLKDIRQEVKNRLLKYLKIACLLGEEMAVGYKDVVQECMDQVDGAAGYIGIFAYWYGSIPPQHQVSITHLEFQRAFQRWEQDPNPPLVIFMPKNPSAAKEELEAQAARVLGNKDETTRERHPELLKGFHQEVRGGWRVVRDFESCDDLYGWIITICSQWKGLTPLEAARGVVEVLERSPERRLPTEEELGLLGRAPHFKAVEDALALATAFPEEPALAFLLSGDEDAGQRAFLQKLLTTPAVRAGRPPRILRPPYEQCDAAALVHLIADGLGLSGTAGAADPTTPRELAEAVHAGLQQQQLCFVLDQSHRIAGGAAAFREQFWLPLYARLKELRAERPTEHRLLGFVADYAGRTADAWGDAALAHDDANGPDYSRLLLLPTFAAFTKLDLLRWMNDTAVPDRPPGRRARLAEAALKNAAGQPDPTPRRVFARLSDEDLWPEGD